MMPRTDSLLPPAARWTLFFTALAGAAVFLTGLVFSPTRSWTGFLMAFNLLVGLALCGGLFLALLHLSGARWADRMQSIPAVMSQSLPGAALLGVIFFFGIPSLYEWSHADVVAQDHLLQQKAIWLNTPGVILRTAICFALWFWVLRKLRLCKSIASGEPSDRDYTLRISALFMLIFAVTYSVVSFDWLMSLQPHWFSTIFALRTATGLVCAGLAAAIILVTSLSQRGALPDISREQLQDLGKLLFGFSILWVYIWYCQYMLIWYANIPEETQYYIARSSPTWRVLTWTSLALNWAIPFAVLLLRPAKRSATALFRVALVVLLGRLIDLYVLIGPPLAGEQPQLGLWELGPGIGVLALFFLVTLTKFSPHAGPQWK